MYIDVVAQLHFFNGSAAVDVAGKVKAQHGLELPYNSPVFRCPIKIEDEYFDAAVITNSETINPGDIVIRGIVFLSPALVRPKLIVGMKILLKKNAVLNYGEGVILEIIDQPRIEK